MLRLINMVLLEPLKCQRVLLSSYSTMGLKMVPLHSKPHLIPHCIGLLKEEWPNSKAERLEILEKSCLGLPCSLILIDNHDEAESTERVLAHVRVVGVKNIENGIYSEGAVIRKEFRDQGLGITLLSMIEDYGRKRGFKWHVLGMKPALSKVASSSYGYTYCDWRFQPIGSGMLHHTLAGHMHPLNLPCPGWERFYIKPEVSDVNQHLIESPVSSETTNHNCVSVSTGRQIDGEMEDPPSLSTLQFSQDISYCFLKKAL